ncbi:50S ribosomal protein L18 [Candidatus Uhrbacteria bacterium]|nr:50S ribosomal protein L18 [Candidatus Uhrbacteria bacterium]
MISSRALAQQRVRRMRRVRAKVQGSTERPRLSVHRSLAHMSAQIIDDVSGKTLVAFRDVDLSDAERKGKTKTELATLVGQKLGEQAKVKGIEKVVFDRRDKKYHGRVKALAEGARAAGLIF